jgi:hypothetical protein
VFRKLVRASDVCKRDAFPNLETWPPRLERSIQIPHCLQFRFLRATGGQANFYINS